MCHGTRKPHKLKVRRYADRMIDINNHLSTFPRKKASDKIGETESSEIILNSMPNVWNNQDYVQGFDSKILFKKSCKYA